MLDAPPRSCGSPVRRRLLLLLSALACVACSKPQPPTITPHVARVSAVSFKGLDLDVEVNVENPNSFPLYADSFSGTLFVAQGQRLGHGASTPAHSIPANGSSLVQTRVHVDWDDLSALAPFMTAESLPYVFRGEVAIGSESFHVTLPFTLSGELTRTQLLQAGLRGL